MSPVGALWACSGIYLLSSSKVYFVTEVEILVFAGVECKIVYLLFVNLCNSDWHNIPGYISGVSISSPLFFQSLSWLINCTVKQSVGDSNFCHIFHCFFLFVEQPRASVRRRRERFLRGLMVSFIRFEGVVKRRRMRASATRKFVQRREVSINLRGSARSCGHVFLVECQGCCCFSRRV